MFGFRLIAPPPITKSVAAYGKSYWNFWIKETKLSATSVRSLNKEHDLAVRRDVNSFVTKRNESNPIDDSNPSLLIAVRMLCHVWQRARSITCSESLSWWKLSDKKLIVLRGLISSALKSKFMKSPEHRSNDKYRISSNRRELNENSDQNPRSSSFQYRKQLVLEGNIHGIYNYR